MLRPPGVNAERVRLRPTRPLHLIRAAMQNMAVPPKLRAKTPSDNPASTDPLQAKANEFQ